MAAVIVFGRWFAIAAGAFSIPKRQRASVLSVERRAPAAALAGLGVGEGLAALSARRWRWAQRRVHLPSGDQKRLVNYRRNARTTEKCLVAVPSAGQAESIIISSGEPVMTLGGFIGSDPILTANQRQTRLASGDVRFVLFGGGGPGGGFGGFGGRGGFGAVRRRRPSCRRNVRKCLLRFGNRETRRPVKRRSPEGRRAPVLPCTTVRHGERLAD